MSGIAPAKLSLIATILLAVATSAAGRAEAPSAAATAGFDRYAGALEAKLAAQHRSASAFVAGLADAKTQTRLRRGETVIEDLTPSGNGDLPGAMLHDWRGTAFVPGVTAAQFERLMQNYAAYPQIYAPEVTACQVMAHQGNSYRVRMRVRQKDVITVVMDTGYDVSFTQLDARQGYSLARSTRIAEIEAAGTPREHALSADAQHGFLWRLNTYWSYEQRDGGLYMQIESISLTRSIPAGLAWAVKPFVESVPRNSLEFTLRATARALRNQAEGKQ